MSKKDKKKKPKQKDSKKKQERRARSVPYDTLVSMCPVTLRKAVEAYVVDCEDHNERLTITGMALALGITRNSLVNFDITADEDIVSVINYAKQLVEEQLEQRLSATAPAGAMFSLKASFGWQDVTKVALGGGPTGDGPVPLTTIDPANLSTTTLKEILAARDASTETD